MVGQSSVRGVVGGHTCGACYFREVRAGEGPEPLSGRLGSGRTPPRSETVTESTATTDLPNFGRSSHSARASKPEDVKLELPLASLRDGQQELPLATLRPGQLVLTTPPE